MAGRKLQPEVFSGGDQRCLFIQKFPGRNYAVRGNRQLLDGCVILRILEPAV
jgi:hypothetical protein